MTEKEMKEQSERVEKARKEEIARMSDELAGLRIEAEHWALSRKISDERLAIVENNVREAELYARFRSGKESKEKSNEV